MTAINWGPTGKLYITGELKLAHWECTVHPGMIRPQFLFEDEAQVKWRINRIMMASEIVPHALPEQFEARYVVSLKKSKFNFQYTWAVDATSLNDAVLQVKEFEKDSYKLHGAEPSLDAWQTDLSSLRKATGDPIKLL